MVKRTHPVWILLVAGAVALSACGRAATPEALPADKGITAPATADQAAAAATPTVGAVAAQKSAASALADQATAAATPTVGAVAAQKSAANALADQAMPADKPAAEAMGNHEPADDAMGADEPAAEAMPAETPVAQQLAWLTAQLTDVRTGQPFALADYQGKVVLVETLAVWCSKCLKQQEQVLALHEALGERDDFVSVGIDIDLNESPEQLQRHTERHGFNWVYAVATPEVAREIGDLYGAQFLNPPATPMLIVDRQGQAHPLPFGIKSAADLQAALAPFLGEGM